jgi:hypothetical protein
MYSVVRPYNGKEKYVIYSKWIVESSLKGRKYAFAYFRNNLAIKSRPVLKEREQIKSPFEEKPGFYKFVILNKYGTFYK